MLTRRQIILFTAINGLIFFLFRKSRRVARISYINYVFATNMKWLTDVWYKILSKFKINIIVIYDQQSK